jgi:DNA-binding NarL/FixJ family response regulator
MFVAGVVQALRSCENIEVVAQGATTLDVLNIAREHQPDIIVIDPEFTNDASEILQTVMRNNPETRIIVMTAREDVVAVKDMLRLGVVGYCLKNTDRDAFLSAVRAVSRGELYLQPSLAVRLLVAPKAKEKPVNRVFDLTPREEQILGIIGEGRSNKEIGRSLDLSEKTIKHHVTNILQKLQVRNRVEAAIMATQQMQRMAAE